MFDATASVCDNEQHARLLHGTSFKDRRNGTNDMQSRGCKRQKPLKTKPFMQVVSGSDLFCIGK